MRAIRRGSAIVLFLCLVAARGSAFEEFYAGVSELLEDSWAANTGMTVFPILELPMGGAREGMGNAFSAVSSDATALYANPASTAVLPFTELSVTHKNYIADTSVEALDYTVRFQELGLGGGMRYLHVPFTGRDEFGRQTVTTRYAEVVGTANVAYNFFRSYYFHGLALGANASVVHRSVPESIAAEQSATAPIFDLGLLTRFNFLKGYTARERNFSVAVVARNFGPSALGEPPPAHVAAGLSYKPIRPLTISAEGALPVSLVPDVPAAPPSVAAGASLEMTDFLTAYAGLNVKGGNPRLAVGTDVALSEVTLSATYTLDMLTQLSGPDNFTIQARLNFGDRGRHQRRERLEDYYRAGLRALARGELEEAAEEFESALDVDDRFQPAREALNTVEESIALQERIETLGDLERAEEDADLDLDDIEANGDEEVDDEVENEVQDEARIDGGPTDDADE